jgi:hypothetical protein
MGTARMGTDAKHAVVDATCAPSITRTYSSKEAPCSLRVARANPTLTMAALALRSVD